LLPKTKGSNFQVPQESSNRFGFSIDTLLLVVEDKAYEQKLARFHYNQAGHATKIRDKSTILNFDQVHTSTLLSSTVTTDSGNFTSRSNTIPQ